jgi:PAS domain S-box-containing protein
MDKNPHAEFSAGKIKIKFRLRLILLVPFIVQIIVISGLVGYISFRNGERAVNEVALSLHSGITERINDYLNDFVETPYKIIQNNAVAIESGILVPDNQTMLERYFLEQIQIYKTVSSIYFGNISGGIAISGREAVTKTTYLMGTDGFRNGILRKYSTTIRGTRSKTLLSVPDFDARSRPWYLAAVSKGDIVWSDPYILFTGQDMAISVSKPLYSVNNRLLGVVSADLFMSHIGDFLSDFDIGKTGLSFIIDQQGLLIAASTNEMIFTQKKDGELQRRLGAGESNSLIIRETAEKLADEFESLSRINNGRHLEFNLDGAKHFIHVAPFKNRAGLEWIIVTVVPESDFMEKISANNRITILLIIGAIIISIIIGIFTSRWIANPVHRLNNAVRELSSGLWPEQSGSTRVVEIDDLKRSFFQMSVQLKMFVENLTSEIKERKITEKALRESEEKYRDLIKYSNTIIFRIDRKGVITYANDYALNFFGYTSDEILWKNVVGTIVPETDKAGRNLKHMIDEITANPELYERNENENIRKDGTTAWIVWSNRGIPGEDGEYTEILCIGTDISERRLAEIEIKKLLSEKEILLHEVHHRIKNNMNTIAGLLYLQSESIENDLASSALKEAHSRVLSMMLIYDKLFRSNDFNNISTAAYLPDLITGIMQTFPNFSHIQVKSEIDDCVMSSNVLVPVGIIINELVTNAYKYAFAGIDEGMINISFLKKGDNLFEIVVKDNGKGIPESIVLGESSGFGLNLVYLLTQQMRGTAEVIRGEGSEIRIKFSV